MEFLGSMMDGGVRVDHYWDAAEQRYVTNSTDVMSLHAKRANAETQKDTRRRKRAEDGEYAIFRTSLADREALGRLYPDLENPDPNIRVEAWNRLAYSPLARPFLMTRPPGQDKVSFSSKPQASHIILPR